MARLSRSYLVAGDIELILPINPYTAQWAYQENTTSFDTIGGRVVQLLSVQVQDLSVTSVAGSRRELQRIADGIKQVMEYHVKTSFPAQFRVPSRGWDFRVYVRALPQVGWEVASTSYPYSLSMAIEEDVSGIKQKQLEQAAIARLAAGIGYQKDFHGGSAGNFQKIVSTVLANATPVPGLGSGLGGSNLGINASAPTGSSSGIDQGKDLLTPLEIAQVAAWALPQKCNFKDQNDYVKNCIYAVAVALCESSGHPHEVASNGVAGLWQGTVGQNGASLADLTSADSNGLWMATELNIDYTLPESSNPYPINTWEHAWWAYWGCFRGQATGYQSHLSVAKDAVTKYFGSARAKASKH